MLEKRIYAGEITTTNEKGDKSDLDYFTSNKYVNCFKKDMELSSRCWDTYNEVIAGREPDREHNSIKTWFKNEEDLGSITMCGQTTIKCPILNVLGVFAEIDIIDTFIEQFDKIDVIKSFSDFRIVTCNRIKMPTFIQWRDMITLGLGMALEEDKSCMLAFKSILDKEYLGEKMPGEDPNYCRIVLNFGFYLLEYVDENTTRLSCCFNIDPKVPMIPWFILNTFLKEIAYYIVLNFKDQMEKLDIHNKVYDERKKKRQKFYDNIASKVTFAGKK